MTTRRGHEVGTDPTRVARRGIGAPSLPLLVEARFRRPEPAAGVLDRPSLRATLDEATRHPLTVVAAPTGFGKTTAVAAWIRGRPDAVAWLALEATEDQPVRLATYLIAAVRRALPDVGASALSALQDPGIDIATDVIGSLANEVGAASTPLVLVLDDYHVIRDPACHAIISALLADLPEPMRVVLITRADPPLALGRMRANGRLREVRADDLRFRPEEIRSVLREVLESDLPEAEVQALADRTEGWPAAMSLLALSMARSDDPRGFLRIFAGSDRHVVDYLSSEVLDAQPPEGRDWLLRTAVLDGVTGDLADAVTGIPGGHARLASTARSNLFVLALDERGEWYRFHRMFREAAVTVLDREAPGAQADLLRRASAWHERRGAFDEAIRDALRADDHQLAATLVSRHYLSFTRGGHLVELRGHLTDLDIERAGEAAGAIAFVAALAGGLAGDEATAIEGHLHDLRERGFGSIRPDGMATAACGELFIRAAFLHDDVGGQLEAGRTLVEGWPDDVFLSGIGHAAVGHASWLRDEMDTARAALGTFEEAVDPRRPMISIYALATRAIVEMEAGDVSLGRRLAREAHAATLAGGLRDTVATATAHLALGAALLGEGRPDASLAALDHAVRLTLPSQPVRRSVALIALARARATTGDATGAAAAAAEAGALIDASRDPGALSRRLRETERAIRERADPTSIDTTPSAAEMRVLRLLPSTLSQREIAGELYLSPDTVKTHIRRLYQKLEANTRGQAVDRARALRLL